MDFSKLSSNEKLAVYGAAAAIIGSVLSFSGIGGGGFGLVTGILMLVIIFLPQFSPGTKLPGSKGSLMLIVGGVSGIVALLALLSILTVLGAFAFYGGMLFIGLLVGIAGQLLMGWASWREFQSEGGKFNVGMASGPSAPPAAPPTSTYTPPPPAPTYTPPPPAAPMTPPMQEPMSGDRGHDEDPQP
jgi:hypothetical protein